MYLLFTLMNRYCICYIWLKYNSSRKGKCPKYGQMGMICLTNHHSSDTRMRSLYFFPDYKSYIYTYPIYIYMIYIYGYTPLTYTISIYTIRHISYITHHKSYIIIPIFMEAIGYSQTILFAPSIFETI